MSSKSKAIFVCQACGFESPKWQGKCSGCDAWNSLVEEVAPKRSAARNTHASLDPVSIVDLDAHEGHRIQLKNQEFNRVVGGGLVPGSVILLGGDPGIGKSTLLLQILNDIANQGLQTLYVSGEESAQQIKLRAERLQAKAKNLLVLTETALEHVLESLAQLKTQVVCIDSVQTLFSNQLETAAGSISQVRQVAALVVEYAKKKNCITFLVGHVTKDGSIAGPRVLEHMVDTVLYFEGDHGHPYRILRTTKNRFGSTNEIGVFEMTHDGLSEVENPSELFLSERSQGAPGSAVTVTLEGTRPLLVELQSLTLPCHGGPPRRTCIGTDGNRVSLLAAVTQRELHITLHDQDLYVNVAGGMKITEPAVDLGLVASMASSRLQVALPPQMVFFGEIGLTGEVRAIQQPALRIQEAAKLGFSHCIFPKNNLKQLSKEWKKAPPVELRGISHIRELLPILRGSYQTLPSEEMMPSARA